MSDRLATRVPRYVYRIGEPVIVNTGGEDAPATVMQLDKKLGIRVAFTNGTSQWMNAEDMRPGGCYD